MIRRNSSPWAGCYRVCVFFPFFSRPEVGGRERAGAPALSSQLASQVEDRDGGQGGCLCVELSECVWGPGMHVPSLGALQHRPSCLTGMSTGEGSPTISSCSNVSACPCWREAGRRADLWLMGQRKHGLSV